jgi:hypothetical protein
MTASANAWARRAICRPRGYVKHPGLSALPKGAVVYGQVQDLPTGAPRVRMEVVQVDAEGIGLQFPDQCA